MTNSLPNASTAALTQNITTQMITVGHRLMLIGTLFFQVLINYYLLSGSAEFTRLSVIFGLVSFGLVIASMFSFKLFQRPNSLYYWPEISAFLMSISWGLMALTLELEWGVYPAAEKLLLIGFFLALFSHYPRNSLLIASLPGYVLFYTYFVISEGVRSELGVVLSIVKFPFLLVVFHLTVRKFILQGQLKFIENIELMAKLQELTHTDELTGLLNRKGFNESLAAALDNARRFDIDLSLMILDIDFFKKYNDSLGHPEGDRCLEQVANILQQQSVRAVDSVCRIGGEEFALILPGSNMDQAQLFAQKILSALTEQQLPHPDSEIAAHVTMSVGVTEFTATDDASTLYKRADTALYQAKANGRNRAEVA